MGSKDIFDWLIRWYSNQCNGIWELENQIKIDTLDNPGWTIEIGLKSTQLEQSEIKSRSIRNEDETNWFVYLIEKATYDASGDTFKLPTLVEIFRSIWENKESIYNPISESMFSWLMEWFQSQCDGDWEHEYGIAINTNLDRGWQVKIEVNFTELDSVSIDRTLIQNGEDDWYSFSLKDGKFLAEGDPKKLRTILEKFKEIWITRAN
ncbi:Imm53 family immunity protein [Leptospira sanjuanensis]|uniref:Imm53 family immunity protein n=1 Tax=Leptospira sanjuanensis TaxID=2879643 RepID=UPI001EE8DD0F|nr:Imm53 family immunity protein [Leptospira sanjuanensis]MCG6168926.1 immunity 53 family protein [Leptospira sanjuanensis]